MFHFDMSFKKKNERQAKAGKKKCNCNPFARHANSVYNAYALCTVRHPYPIRSESISFVYFIITFLMKELKTGRDRHKKSQIYVNMIKVMTNTKNRRKQCICVVCIT